MLGNNATPFAAIGFEQAHRDGSDMGVIAVRGSFAMQPAGDLTLCPEQAIVLVDEYEGAPQATPLLKGADLIPFKPSTDVTVLANSYPPHGTSPAEGWLAGVRVGDYRYPVRVFGQRRWNRSGHGFSPGRANSVEPTSIDYRNAWSDLADGETPGDPAPFNPIGVRRPTSADLESDAVRPMARLEAVQEDYSTWHGFREPQGFGPLPPFWRQRQQFAGTYDEDWKANRHPYLPKDFDYRFYQCAHPRLICRGFLRGDEEFELYRLSALAESIRFRLPALGLRANFLWRDERRVSMRLNLDGVHIDARGETIFVDLTWRGWLPICPQFRRIDIWQSSLDSPEMSELPPSGLHGLDGVDATGEVVA